MPWASSTVTVSVVVLEPLAVKLLGLAASVVLVDTGAPATKVTLAVSTMDPMVAVILFTSAVVEAMVVVYVPEAPVLPEGAAMVLLVPEQVNTTL